MNARRTRMAIASALVALMVSASIEPVLATIPTGQSSGSASASKARRDKNGRPQADYATPNPKPSDAGTQPSVKPRNDPVQGGSQSDPAAGRSSVPSADKDPFGREDSTEPSSSASAADSPQERGSPPPFNRPSQTNDQNRRMDRTNIPYEPPGTVRPSDRAGSPPDVTDNRVERESDRGGRRPPVLGRPSDSAGESSGSAGPGDVSVGGSSDRQGAPMPADESGGTIKLGATLVNIPVLVSDRSGRYVPQLTERDFSLYEDGTHQEIAFFGSEEVPFNVVLLLDLSPSVRNRAEDIQDAAIEFVRQLRSQDQVMIGSFDQRVEFLTGFTNNRSTLERAIRSTVTGNGTSVYDAVYQAVAQRMRNVDGRKALILFSDGEDTTSRQASYEDAIDIVTESDVLVYGLRYPSGGGGIRTNPRDPFPGMDLPFPLPLPFPWPRRRRRGNFSDGLQEMTGSAAGVTSGAQSRRRGWGGGRDFMTDVTTAGGGPVYDADAIGDLSRLARRIAEELRHVYMISYYPTNPISNGGFRSIRVRVNRSGDLAVRHRRGYHARETSSGNTD